MAFADSAAYKAAVSAPSEVNAISATSATLWAAVTTTPPLTTMWPSKAPNPGSAPGAAAACTRTTTGALGQQDGGSGSLFAVAVDAVGLRLGTTIGNGEITGSLILADRLSHQSGLVGNSSTTQTTNLPTAALTRYTSGAGVWAALEVYSSIGNNTSVATVSYTNQAGTSGQSGFAVVGNGSQGAAAVARQMALISLAQGDTGVRSVESVTLSVALAAPGNVGVTLFRPLLFVPLGVVDAFPQDVLRGTLGGGMPEILDGACLWWMLAATPSSTVNGTVTAQLSFTEA